MGIFLGWILFSVIVGFIGSGRKIGFAGAFFLSLLLSPLIGLIITLVSKDKADEAHKQAMLETLQKQQQTLTEQTTKPISNQASVVEELERLKKLREENHITEDEYRQLKNKLIAKFD